jgi:hypothetical protein
VAPTAVISSASAMLGAMTSTIGVPRTLLGVAALS